ncbi:outer membrane protein assembly factor BamB family protein [Pontibacillus chungwhensis]|nr:PQQ-binding-like beta-propeller repeat protein [Pontibacillus chungwhensis]
MMRTPFKAPTLMFLILSIVVLPTLSFANSVSAEDFGPSDWTQYRMNPDNNPVFHNDFEEQLNMIIDTNDQIRSTPVIVGNNVYIGNHNTGDIYSYNLIEEKMNWQAQAPNWIHSETIYVDDQLFVGYGNRFGGPDGVRGTGESGMLSLDPETGEILWNFKTKGEVMPTPAYHDRTVYITTGDDHLYAVDPKDGTEKWKLKLGHVVSMSSPNIKDGILYVGAGRPTPYTFFAIDLSAQEVLWKTEFNNVYAGLDDVPPAIYKDDLVITTALEPSEKGLDYPEHFMYAMDLETGEVVWKESFGSGEMVQNNKSGAPMIYKDKIFVGSPITRTFYAYDAKSGEQSWSYESNINKAPPVADQDVVYFTDAEGFVYAFNTEDGELLGKKELGGTLAPSGPVLMNNHLITGSQDSNVYVMPTSEVTGIDEEKNENGQKEGEQETEETFSTTWIISIIVGAILAFALIMYGIRKVKK